jgi:hypothetical protein
MGAGIRICNHLVPIGFSRQTVGRLLDGCQELLLAGIVNRSSLTSVQTRKLMRLTMTRIAISCKATRSRSHRHSPHPPIYCRRMHTILHMLPSSYLRKFRRDLELLHASRAPPVIWSAGGSPAPERLSIVPKLAHEEARRSAVPGARAPRPHRDALNPDGILVVPLGTNYKWHPAVMWFFW